MSSYPGYTPQSGYSGPPPPSQAQSSYPGAAHHQAPQGFPQPIHSHSGQGINPPAGPPGAPGQQQHLQGASNAETTGTADGVQYHIAYRDSNSLLSLRLQGGTEIKAKPGSMVAMDGSVQIKGKMKFSFKKLLKGGEVCLLPKCLPNPLSQTTFCAHIAIRVCVYGPGRSPPRARDVG